MAKKAMTLAYSVGDKLYINLTNKCPCACTFCIRNNGDGAYGSDPLWLEHEPSLDEMTSAIVKAQPMKYTEVVFCGYGEPTNSLELLLSTADFVKKNYPGIPTRLNTNGLSDLINEKPTAHLLKDRIDTVSVSLNAPEKEDYLKVTRPKFGDKSFDEMLRFACECKQYVKKVMFTIVNILPEKQIEDSKKLADSLGIKLRIREYIE